MCDKAYMKLNAGGLYLLKRMLLFLWKMLQGKPISFTVVRYLKIKENGVVRENSLGEKKGLECRI